MEIAISTEEGNKMTVALEAESATIDSRYGAILYINDQPHHLERLPKQQLLKNYIVDADADYNPVSDEKNYCYILVPASQ